MRNFRENILIAIDKEKILYIINIQTYVLYKNFILYYFENLKRKRKNRCVCATSIARTFKIYIRPRKYTVYQIFDMKVAQNIVSYDN